MAHQAIQKAVDLSGHASPAEQAYIQAMALRFPADPKADRKQATEAYRDAMREVAQTFPMIWMRPPYSPSQPEYNIIADAEKKTPEDAIFAMPINHKTKIASEVLGAKIAMAKKDSSEAIAMLTDAVAVQDSLKYGEPPDWFFRCASRWAPPC